MKKIILLLSIVVVFSCNITGESNDPNNNEQNGTNDNTSLNAKLKVSGFKANLENATTIYSIKGNGNSRKLSGEALLKLTEDGNIESILNAPEGVIVPTIKFTAVSKEGAVFICFNEAFNVSEGLDLYFIKILPDNSIEVIESGGTINSYDWEWNSKQDPVTFTDDGAVYYSYYSGGKNSLRKYNNGKVTILTPEINLSIERFFSNGSTVFYQARNQEENSNAFYLKAIDKYNKIEDVIYKADGECWLKDVYTSGSDIVISGWNIPDPKVDTRFYNGVLKVSKEGGSYSITQVFGDGSTASGFVRRILSKKRMQFDLDKYNNEASTKLSISEFSKLAVSHFFVDNVVPENFNPWKVVDIDKAEDMGTPELTFWYDLLKGYSGFDINYFNLVKEVGDVFPYIESSSDSLPLFLYNMLFTDESISSLGLSVDVDSFIDTLRSNSNISSFFTEISLKGDVPLRMPYVLDGTMEDFLEYLNSYFSYEPASGIDFTDLRSYWSNLSQTKYYSSDLYDLQGWFKKALYDTELEKYYTYRDLFLLDNGSVDEIKVKTLLSKFYSTINSYETVGFSDISSNLEFFKIKFMDSNFNLSKHILRIDPDYFTHTTFMVENTTSGYSTDPYLEQKLTLDTLFDNFSTMKFFFPYRDNEIYGVFPNRDGTSRLSMIMDESGYPVNNSVIDGFVGENFVLDGDMVYCSSTNDKGISILSTLDMANETISEIIGTDEGIELYKFEPATNVDKVFVTGRIITTEEYFIGFIDLNTKELVIPDESITIQNNSDVDTLW